jgi:hypothetical protein
VGSNPTGPAELLESKQLTLLQDSTKEIAYNWVKRMAEVEINRLSELSQLISVSKLHKINIGKIVTCKAANGSENAAYGRFGFASLLNILFTCITLTWRNL